MRKTCRELPIDPIAWLPKSRNDLRLRNLEISIYLKFSGSEEVPPWPTTAGIRHLKKKKKNFFYIILFVWHSCITNCITKKISRGFSFYLPSEYFGGSNLPYWVLAAPKRGFCKLLQLPSNDLYKFVPQWDLMTGHWELRLTLPPLPVS